MYFLGGNIPGERLRLAMVGYPAYYGTGVIKISFVSVEQSTGTSELACHFCDSRSNVFETVM